MTLVIKKPTGGKLIMRKGWQPMDSDAATYIAAVEAADGQALEEKTKIAIDNFVLGCKADGIWTAIKASCILAGARTLAGALVPLVGAAPTNFNFVAGDYNRKTGLVGDGTTKYLNSNRNNNADPQNSKHLAVYANSVTTTLNQTYIGCSYGQGFSALNTLNSTTGSFNVHADNTALAPSNVAGFLGANRPASNIQQGRGNRSTLSNSTASQTQRNDTIKVFTSNSAAASTFAPARLAFYSIGESLDLAKLDARVTDLINAFAAAIP